MHYLSIFFGLIIVILSLVMVVILLNILFLLITRIPAVNSPKKYHKIILDKIDVKNKIVYDLGCGDATFLIEAHRRGAKKCLGYEIALWPYLVAIIKTLNKPILIKFNDFFKKDVSKANVVFIYLVKGILPKVSDKLKKELKKGTIIVSIGSEFFCFKQIKKIPLSKKYYAHIYRV